MLSRRVMGGACHPGGGDYSIFKWKTILALGEEASPAASAMDGAYLTLQGWAWGEERVYPCVLSRLLKTPVLPLLNGQQLSLGSRPSSLCCSSPAGAASWLPRSRTLWWAPVGETATPQLWNLAMAEFPAFRIGFCFNTCTYNRSHLIKDAAWINQKTAIVGSIVSTEDL